MGTEGKKKRERVRVTVWRRVLKVEAEVDKKMVSVWLKEEEERKRERERRAPTRNGGGRVTWWYGLLLFVTFLSQKAFHAGSGRREILYIKKKKKCPFCLSHRCTFASFFFLKEISPGKRRRKKRGGGEKCNFHVVSLLSWRTRPVSFFFFFAVLFCRERSE